MMFNQSVRMAPDEGRSYQFIEFFSLPLFQPSRSEGKKSEK